MFEGLYLLVFLGVSLLVTMGLGGYMAAVFEDKPVGMTRFLAPIEKGLLKLGGVAGTNPQNWKQYAFSLVIFNLLCGLIAFVVLTAQHMLPFNPLKLSGMEPWQAFNTICSFVANTNWQSYSGEVSLSNFTQMMGITALQSIGAVSGLAVCVGFLRLLTHRPVGNFYRDFTRSLLYVFLPVLLIGSLFFISQGVPQTLEQQVVVKTLEGASQKIAMGPVASLLTIKQFGTNGGGFFNANSAHPFENPNPITNFAEFMLELAIPMGLVSMFAVWLKDRKQGWMIWSAMMLMFLTFLGIAYCYEQSGNTLLSGLSTTGNMEGKEVRFGILPSVLFTVSTTATSTGAVNNMHDSLTPIAGLAPLMDMMLNVVFGGVGVGLMGFLLYGIIAVFLTGLMVGRTPEIFGKKIEKPEIILASIAILLHPLLILTPTAIASSQAFGLNSLNNLGPHGLSEILYAYTSAAANNGSAFAGLNANTTWYNISIGIVILLGRYISIIALLAIGGSLFAKPKLEPGPGTLYTNTLLFAVIWLGVILIVGALTFVPALVLGPIAEQLAMLHGTLY